MFFLVYNNVYLHFSMNQESEGLGREVRRATEEELIS